MRRCYSSGCRPKPIRVGKDGKSAYEIWAEAQPEGSDTSMEAYLEYMRGKDGKDGVDGQDGKDGIQSVAVKGPALIGDGSTDKPLEVPVSKQSGNLLEVRTDGLYYGIEAPADLSRLYVDNVNGSDSNPGTRALPFQTLAKALNVSPSTQSNTIYLKAGGDFYLTGHTINGATRNIDLYDDPYRDGNQVPTISPTIPWYYPMSVSGLNRPTIRAALSYNQSNGYVSTREVNVSNGGRLVISGCNIATHAYNDSDTENVPEPPEGVTTWRRGDLSMFRVRSGASALLRGCTLELATTGYKLQMFRNTLEGELGAVAFNRCRVLNESTDSVTFLNVGGAGSTVISVDNWGGNPGPWVNEDPDNRATLVGNMAEALLRSGYVAGVIRDTNNAPRNLLSNLVL